MQENPHDESVQTRMQIRIPYLSALSRLSQALTLLFVLRSVWSTDAVMGFLSRWSSYQVLDCTLGVAVPHL